ncbi:hypothetical protein AOXY_G30983 [Acipenser oxyrinchus oxyrinchus]|uniref:Uncharacterized protein n=1 Tax=Acipenser oxyrinchus oxyrinchus TaxID=40147 RepID=A0AAD8CKX5_ACIOX|nr:hypothetical protein AOXY_G31325 [Acipenser oxyrinchus oxyrinchus]KAK1152860.1 hypothetical protein AOXY_G30983 [Acipenser oxyrinchus oxyrinchus]
MKRHYRRRLPEERKEPHEKRVICEICKVSYNSVHYEQYHEHRCTKGTDHVEAPNESLEVIESLEVGEMSASLKRVLSMVDRLQFIQFHVQKQKT